jgi:UDP-2,3-diacylglucosamine pyrophosphatase LpxH
MATIKSMTKSWTNRVVIPDYHQAAVAKLKANNWEYPNKGDYEQTRGVIIFLDEESYSLAVNCWSKYKPK